MQSVADVRQRFIDVRNDPDHRVAGTIELIGESFIADEPSIFLKPNEEYISREIEWYESQSRFVDDIPGDVPRIWKSVSSRHGMINSNYGYLFYSEENFSQFRHVVDEMIRDNHSRRAVAIYTHPTIHMDAYSDGMCDFICTNTVTYEMRRRGGRWFVDAVVNMRSNDVVYGYRNDRAWQIHALKRVVGELNAFYHAHHESDVSDVYVGDVYWQVASLHIYQRHWHLLGDDVREDL